MQVVLGTVTAVAACSLCTAHAVTVLPGLVMPVPGVAYALLCAFTYVAEVNAVNLTDGIDGLGASCSAVVLAACALLAAPCNEGVAVFCAATAGACCGFLAWNRHPARVFMGDAGAQGLGAAVAVAACFTAHFVAVATLSAVFVTETLSVILQVRRTVLLFPKLDQLFFGYFYPENMFLR